MSPWVSEDGVTYGNTSKYENLLVYFSVQSRATPTVSSSRSLFDGSHKFIPINSVYSLRPGKAGGRPRGGGIRAGGEDKYSLTRTILCMCDVFELF